MNDSLISSQSDVIDLPPVPTVFDIPDITNLIADYCDDESLSKISRVNLFQLTSADKQRH